MSLSHGALREIRGGAHALWGLDPGHRVQGFLELRGASGQAARCARISGSWLAAPYRTGPPSGGGRIGMSSFGLLGEDAAEPFHSVAKARLDGRLGKRRPLPQWSRTPARRKSAAGEWPPPGGAATASQQPFDFAQPVNLRLRRGRFGQLRGIGGIAAPFGALPPAQHVRAAIRHHAVEVGAQPA